MCCTYLSGVGGVDVLGVIVPNWNRLKLKTVLMFYIVLKSGYACDRYTLSI